MAVAEVEQAPKYTTTTPGARLLQPASPSCFLMVPLMMMTTVITIEMVMVMIEVMMTLLSITNS